MNDSNSDCESSLESQRSQSEFDPDSGESDLFSQESDLDHDQESENDMIDDKEPILEGANSSSSQSSVNSEASELEAQDSDHYHDGHSEQQEDMKSDNSSEDSDFF
jgi:hypothetical protein